MNQIVIIITVIVAGLVIYAVTLDHGFNRSLDYSLSEAR